MRLKMRDSDTRLSGALTSGLASAAILGGIALVILEKEAR
jgi:hypothetical protein